MDHLVHDRFFRLLAAYPVGLSILTIVNLVAPQRGGALALSQIFAPYLLIPVLALVPVALTSASQGLRIGIMIAFALGAVRLGPGLLSIPATPPSREETLVRILSWNLDGGVTTAAELMAQLRASDADIVALQELTTEHAAAIRADHDLTAQYPHAALVPRGGAAGLGILSRFRIEDATDSLNPAYQEVEVQVQGRGLTVINAHPFAPRFFLERAESLPVAYDPAQRDADILRIRESIDRELAATRPLIVLGDFNVSDREPGFEDLSRGLWDAHNEIGQGMGNTWRPHELKFLPFGVLRLDHFLGGPATRPLSVALDCTPRSDHCILAGSAAVN